MAGLPQDASVRWLDISIAQIVQIFKEHGICISPYIARKMIKLRGFKKRSFHKTKTLKEIKNRDAQFKLLEATWTSCVRLGIPVLSIDTKKKEMLGNFKRAGKTFCCQELAALDHDFVSFSNGTVIPHGIYDVKRNVGYLTIGNSHNTAEFVVTTSHVFGRITCNGNIPRLQPSASYAMEEEPTLPHIISSSRSF